MKLFKDAEIEDGEPISEELKIKLKYVETYVIRSVICGVSVANFNKECPILIKGDKSIQEYMTEKELTDENTLVGLKHITNNALGKLLLFWSELFKQHEDKKEADKALFFMNYTLEHVMPQSWDQYWGIDSLAVYDSATNKIIADKEEASVIRSAAVYELGNMALLSGSLNSAISNYEMERKINGDPKGRMKDKTGIKDHATLLTTKEIVDTYKEKGYWDERTILERTSEISKLVLKIWPVL